MGKYTVLLFIGFLFTSFVLTFLFAPETKAKTVDMIYAELQAGQVWRGSRALPANRIEPVIIDRPISAVVDRPNSAVVDRPNSASVNGSLSAFDDSVIV